MINEFLIKPLMYLPLFYGVSSFAWCTIEEVKISRSRQENAYLAFSQSLAFTADHHLLYLLWSNIFTRDSIHFFSSARLQVANGRPLVLLHSAGLLSGMLQRFL